MFFNKPTKVYFFSYGSSFGSSSFGSSFLPPQEFNVAKAKKAIENSDFSKFYLNTAYTEALSMPEINYVLNEYIFGDPKVQLIH